MSLPNNSIPISLTLATAALLAGCGAGTQESGSAQAAAQQQSGQLAGTRALATAAPLQDIDRIDTGDANTVALAANGTVYTWGSNAYGQLGNATYSAPGQFSKVPVVAGLSGVRAVAAGPYHVLALGQNGQVSAWGANDKGQLGYGPVNTQAIVPWQVPGLSNVKAIAAGRGHSTAITQNGGVWGWGSVPGRTAFAPPAPVKELRNAQILVAGADFNLAVKKDGTVWGWGGNSNGQLGIGTRTSAVAVPVQLSGLDKVVALSAGEVHAIALRQDGTLWSWGGNFHGQLGYAGTSAVPRQIAGLPVPVGGASGVKAVVAGPYNSAVLYKDGSVWAWGDNSAGQLGNGITGSSSAPVRINSVGNIAAVSISNRFIVLLATDGRVYGFGANGSGQLGNNTVSRSSVPVQVVGLSGVGYLNLGKSSGR